MFTVPDDMRPLPSEPKEREMMLQALRHFSDTCEPGALHAQCPFSVHTSDGLGCGEECQDVLGEYPVTSPTGVAIELSAEFLAVPVNRPRPRSSLGADRIPFDAAKIRQEEEDYSETRQSPTTLLLRLADLLSEPPKELDGMHERHGPFDAIVSELYRRGFNVEEIVREAIVPMVATVILSSILLPLLLSDEIDFKLVTPADWLAILLADAGLPTDLQEARDYLQDRTSMEAVSRLVGLGRDGVERWLDTLSLSDLLDWSSPTSEQFAKVLATPTLKHASTSQLWTFERFTKTYIEQWTTDSLQFEWKWLHGATPAPCSRISMKARRLKADDVARTIADRFTSANPLNRNAELIVGRYVPMAVELLQSGERVAAAAVFDVACELSPSSADAHNNRGFCRVPDEPSEALADFEHALLLGPSNPPVTIANKVLCLHKLGRNTTALKVAEDAWESLEDGNTATLWDYSSKGASLLQDAQPRYYLAGLAARIAALSGDSLSATIWKARATPTDLLA
jgi:tetratricopeptide (TPR) repeat protein